MNSFGKTLLALAGFCLMSGTSYAETRGKSQAVNSVVDIGDIPGKLEAKQKHQLPVPPRDANAAQTLGAAPALTYLEVDYVWSTNVGYESVGGLQSTTTADHGGANLVVITDELGYGNNPVATWNGGQISLTTNYKTQTICVNWANNGYEIPCLAGQTVIGWRKYWDFSGYQNGIFTYQNQSTNSPWNTMYDSMSIK